MRQSGLTLLLPHGFDGTGPEHSSSKIERFLQLVDSNGINSLCNEIPDHRRINMCVVQPTKPSNYFHLLRRQMLRSYRKPLIVATPKIGLKHSSYLSNIEEFTFEQTFKPIIINNMKEDMKNLKGIIFCSGQIFMEINKQLQEQKSEKYINIRIEELAPFPENEIIEVVSKYSKNKDLKFYWIQEESMNVGCFTYIVPHLRRILRKLDLNSREINYIGREAQPGANGCVNDHKNEVTLLNESIKNLISS
jgi:probable 2-oxoglutarate dehydrogenase E1 component DHKTD1